MLRATLLALSLALSAPQVSADTLDDADNAYDREDFDTAVKIFRKLAEQGDAAGQINLGKMYANGEGVLQDYAETVKWYRLAAEQGNAYAQVLIGLMYANGMGVAQDNIMTYMWYSLASANGDEDAGEWRDELAAQMTAADLAKARAMARECMNSGYKNCGD